MSSFNSALFSVLISTLLVACGGGSAEQSSTTVNSGATANPPVTTNPPVETPEVDEAQLVRGEAVFINPNPQGNVFSCGTCPCHH